MDISIIVAMDKNQAIGKNGKIPWHSKEDLQYFKSLTIGHPIIMGKNTWKSLNGKPLKERFNIVLTSDESLIDHMSDNPFGPLYQNDLIETLTELHENGVEEVFIIGGGKLYDDALHKNVVDKMYINIMKNVEVENADTFFPYIDPAFWMIEKAETEFKDFDAYLYLRNPDNEKIYDFD
jgi:dihydrofolate reductase